MPQILVIADTTTDTEPAAVQLREWVKPALLDSEHYAAQLLERVRWAAEDAAAVERERRG